MTNRSTIARTVRIAARTAIGVACGFALYPVAATAAPVDNPPVATTAPAPAKKAGMDREVCLRDELTGSRIARTVCKTRGEWIEQTGQDPLAQK